MKIEMPRKGEGFTFANVEIGDIFGCNQFHNDLIFIRIWDEDEYLFRGAVIGDGKQFKDDGKTYSAPIAADYKVIIYPDAVVRLGEPK